MKSIAALCLLGLATAVKLQGDFDPYYSWDEILEYVDENKDGIMSEKEKSDAVEKALDDDTISREKAEYIRNLFSTSREQDRRTRSQRTAENAFF